MTYFRTKHIRRMTASALAGLALIVAGTACAAETPSASTPPVPENQSVLASRLATAKKDMEALRVFQESFRRSNDPKALAQLRKPTEDLLARHVDNLLMLQGEENWNLETLRLSVEVTLLKARLLANLDQKDAAQEIIGEMRKRFGSNLKISVQVSGRTTTLEEGIRLLEDELTAPAAAEKPKG